TRQIVERIAEALETSGVEIVPRVQINSGGEGGNGMLQSLIGMLLSEKGLAMQAAVPAANDDKPAEAIAAE
ncbi:MAG: hypothetical protein JWN66_3342, partial [Sphingomonas bacterium]|nr:hypothetical protein [Sphingomonas bacterium]